MAKTSAGILLYRRCGAAPEVFLVHPGGPFWAKRDDGAWSIPKGETLPGADPLATARREFREETGFDLAFDLLLQITALANLAADHLQRYPKQYAEKEQGQGFRKQGIFLHRTSLRGPVGRESIVGKPSRRRLRRNGSLTGAVADSMPIDCGAERPETWQCEGSLWRTRDGGVARLPLVNEGPLTGP